MENTANREIQISKVLKASIDLVWEVWTKPQHLTNWWGPEGFTSTIHQLDFIEDGEWKLTLHGPNGINYENLSVFKEIERHKKIVFEHFYPHFMTTVLFEADGENTRVNWTLLFNTEEMRDVIIKTHKADEGQKQNIERLEKYLLNVELL